MKKIVTLTITVDSYYTGHKSVKQIPLLYMHSILSQLNEVQGDSKRWTQFRKSIFQNKN